MNELENILDFETMDDGLDIGAIFGTENESDISENPFEKAVEKEEKTQEKPTQMSISIFDKLPIFSYGGAKEEIADTSQTFEELRIEKADDFPELEDGKSVSWTVKYGAVSQNISDPKGKTIAQVKEEIEKSKAFLTGLQKAKDKDKNPDCLVTPSVKAKSKGIATYKGVFQTIEEAKASDKVICLLPSKSGQVFEMRRTELGEFIVPKQNIKEFSEIRAGFTPALPLISRELMGQIIAFFRNFITNNSEYEALVYIYWDRKMEEFKLVVPMQKVTKTSVNLSENEAYLNESRYLLYADIHSHNCMEVKFSLVDDKAEIVTRLYIVLGNLDRFYPTISTRISCGGTYLEINPELVIEGLGKEFPSEWLSFVTCEELP